MSGQDSRRSAGKPGEADPPGNGEATGGTGNSEEIEDTLSLRDTLRILFGASRAFWQVNLINFGDGVAYFGILTLLTLFIANRIGFSDHATSIAVSTFTGLVTLFMLGGGFVSDKLGVRRALSLCLFLLVIGRGLLTISPSAGGDLTVVLLWSSILVMAAAEGIIQPALYAGVKEFTDPRTATIGYSLLYSIMNVGIVVETFLSPFLRAKFGIEGVYAILTGFTVLLLIANLLGFTRKIEQRDRIVHLEEIRKEKDIRSLWEKIRSLPFLDTRFIFFLFVLLPVRTLFAHQFLTIPQYIERCFTAGVFARYEWFAGLNPLIIIIFVPVIAAMTRKVHVVKMMIIGTTVSAITTFILVPGPHLATLILYIIFFSFGEAIWSSRFLEYVADIAPAGRVGAYMGIAGIPWFLAKSTTGLYSGLMIEKFIPAGGPHDSGTMWLIYALIACLTPIGLAIGSRWMKKGV